MWLHSLETRLNNSCLTESGEEVLFVTQENICEVTEVMFALLVGYSRTEWSKVSVLEKSLHFFCSCKGNRAAAVLCRKFYAGLSSFLLNVNFRFLAMYTEQRLCFRAVIYYLICFHGKFISMNSSMKN